MERLYLKPSLCKAIAEYCEVNDIEDINTFANRCAMQGFNIVKYGLSPGDNIQRENNGIKDFKNEENISSRTEREKLQDEAASDNSSRKEEVCESKKEVKKRVTVRKIQIIKKDKND